MERIKIKKRSAWGILRLAIIITAVYLIVFSPAAVKFMVRTLIKNTTDAVIELDIKRASPLYGFDISNVSIFTKENNTPIFRAERILFSYSFFSLMIGHVGIRKIEILRPSIYLIKQNGKWNIESLFSLTSEESPEETADAEKKFPDFINFYYPLKFYASIFIKELSFHYSDDSDASLQKIDVSNINFFTVIITKTIRGIPLDEEILDIFDTFSAGINPHINPEISVTGSNSFSANPEFNWYIFHDKSMKNIFSSRLHIQNIPVHRAGPSGLKRTANLRYKISYNSKKDTLVLREFYFNVNGNTWIDGNASVTNISGSNLIINADFKKSVFYMDPSYYLFQLFAGYKNKPMTLDGNISQLHINGPPEKLRIKCSAALNRFDFYGADFPIHIKNLKNDSDAVIDLFTVLPLKRKPENYVQKKNLAFGIFYKLNIPYLTLNFNGSKISLFGSILPETGISIDANMIDFNILPFTGPDLTGYLNGNIKLISDETFNNISFNSAVKIKNGRFLYGRSLSKHADYQINGNGIILMDETAVTVSASSLSIQGKNSAGRDILSLQSRADIKIFETRDVYNFYNMNLVLNMQDLYPVLPGEMQYEIKPAKKILSRGLIFDSKYFSYRGSATTTEIVSDLKISIPYLNLDDVILNTDVFMGPGVTRINKFSLNALRGSLLASASGNIIETKDSVIPDIKLNIFMQHDKTVRVHENLLMQGGLNVNFIINERAAVGKIVMKDLNILYEGNKCDRVINSPECIRYYVHNMNLNFPVYHDMRYNAKLNDQPVSIPVSKPFVLRKDANLIAQYVTSSHNPRGEFFPDGYMYLGSPNSGKPGLSGHINYSRNTLDIPWLKMLLYKSNTGRKVFSRNEPESSIEGKDLHLHLSDLSPENMNLSAYLKISNLDLEPFLPGSNVKYDGHISADLKAECTGLDDFLNNAKVRVSVHQLSPRFSGFATRIVMPDQFTARLVRGTLKIPSISLELNEGLIYSSISIERGGIFPGLFIRPSGENISQERVPIARFLERAKSEATEIAEELKSEESDDE